ncbi:MAG: hypothetical protein AABX11_07425 [Nanoarchaeota archaeon]
MKFNEFLGHVREEYSFKIAEDFDRKYRTGYRTRGEEINFGEALDLLDELLTPPAVPYFGRIGVKEEAGELSFVE